MKINQHRRQLIAWSAPILATVSLPVHAQCSADLDPNASPVVSADVKCVLNQDSGQFIGNMVITIASDGGPISINNIDVSGLGAEDMVTLPDFPVIVTSTSTAEILWNGVSSDGVTCLPVSNFTLTITYGCSNVDSKTTSVNIIDLLA